MKATLSATGALIADAQVKASAAESGGLRTNRACGYEADFLAANGAAMNKMMAAMTVVPTGDVDGHFVAMMVPHHQGAVDMARTILRSGSLGKSS